MSDVDSTGSSGFGPSAAGGRTLKLWLGISMVKLDLVSAEIDEEEWPDHILK